jgi:L-alanine-DL-glutamate epimerase-like enolase superfamily enzyme
MMACNTITKMKSMEIIDANSNFEREPLIRPFGFKGGYLTEIWQTMAWLRSANDHESVGLCTQNILWSDAHVFQSHSEAGGNALMYAITEKALQLVKGKTYANPIQAQEDILEPLFEYGKEICSHPGLRKTFVLNALVGVDNAFWILYAHENGIKDFDALIPESLKAGLGHRHKQVAGVPLVGYTIPISEIEQLVDEGFFFIKMKLGQPGTQSEMLEKDKSRLEAIHKAIGDKRTPHTKDGKLPYYFDANGRYEKKETLLSFLDFAKKIGAYDQILIIEEPFPEHAGIDVHDIEVRLAADESAHTDEDAIKRIEQGYRAIALKPIAKTVSMTLKIIKAAYEHEIPCFCADLTVNPILVEWNKMFAARLSPMPGVDMGLMETNGHQNYRDWDRMRSYHPFPQAAWSMAEKGIFKTDADFYAKNGGILDLSDHYLAVTRKKK